MSEETNRCTAQTKTGALCKNKAQANSDYCYAHRNLAKHTAIGALDDQERLSQLVAELNELAAELRQQTEGYKAPPFSRDELLKLLKENVNRFTPEIVTDLQNSLQGSSPKDFLDPDTWKGMWYILNYMVESESGSLKETLTTRLKSLPGAKALADWLR